MQVLFPYTCLFKNKPVTPVGFTESVVEQEP
jgi:hypothetical protein